TNLDVVEDSHGGEKCRTLEGAADANRGDIGSRTAAQRVAVQTNVAALGPIKPAQAIEQCGLAGAVRADQSGDAAFAYREADIFERDDAAEPHRQLRDFQQWRGRARRRGRHGRRRRRPADPAALCYRSSSAPPLLTACS